MGNPTYMRESETPHEKFQDRKNDLRITLGFSWRKVIAG